MSNGTGEARRQYSWAELKNKVKYNRLLVSQYGWQIPSTFALHSIDDDEKHLYFLCNDESGRETTLFKVSVLDVPGESGQLRWHKVLDSRQLVNPLAASKDEVLLNERKRSSLCGISQYDSCPESGKMICSAGGRIYQLICKCISFIFFETQCYFCFFCSQKHPRQGR